MTTLTLIEIPRPTPDRPDRPARVAGPAGHRPPPAGPAPRRLHLTRRGRFVLLLVALLAVGLAFSVGRVSAQAAPTGPPPTLTVQSGDTLWEVAAAALPEADPRAAVVRVAELNGLDEESPLRPGQVLVLPRA